MAPVHHVSLKGVSANPPAAPCEYFDRHEPWALAARPAQDHSLASHDPVPFDIIDGLRSDFLLWSDVLGIGDRGALLELFNAVSEFEPERVSDVQLSELRRSCDVFAMRRDLDGEKLAFVCFKSLKHFPGMSLSYHVRGQVRRPPAIVRMNVPNDLEPSNIAELDALDITVMRSAMNQARFLHNRRSAEVCAWLDPALGETMQRLPSFLEILRRSGGGYESQDSACQEILANQLSSGRLMIHRIPYQPFVVLNL